MSADDRKRDNKVAVRLSDRELLDLSRNAALDERSLGDYTSISSSVVRCMEP